MDPGFRRECGFSVGNTIAQCTVTSVLEDPGGAGAFPDPDLRLAPAEHRVVRRVDRVEEGLLLVEIGAVYRFIEPDDPPRAARLPANLECLDRHRFLRGRGSHPDQDASPLRHRNPTASPHRISIK